MSWLVWASEITGMAGLEQDCSIYQGRVIKGTTRAPACRGWHLRQPHGRFVNPAVPVIVVRSSLAREGAGRNTRERVRSPGRIVE